MTKYLSFNRYLFSFLFILFLYSVLIIFSNSLAFQSQSDLFSTVVSLDLLVSIPIIYYFLIRKTTIPKTTVVPIMILGFLIGSYILPQENQSFLQLFKNWFLPILEISIFVFVVLKLKAVIKVVKKSDTSSPDYFLRIKEICRELLPEKIAYMMAMEISVFYYGFFSWRNKEVSSNEYTYHKRSGTTSLLAVFMFLIAIETFVLRILLVRWNVVFAWVLTALSIYTAIQIFGLLKSMSRRPIAIKDDVLELKYGIFAETYISLKDIQNIKLSRESIKPESEIIKLSPLGELESHNIIIELAEEYTLTSIYGIKKRFKKIALFVDEKESFYDSINSAITNLDIED